MISFWFSQLQEIGEGEAGEQVVSEGCVQPRLKRGGVELEAFVPYSNFPASRAIAGVRGALRDWQSSIPIIIVLLLSSLGLSQLSSFTQLK